MNEKEKINLIGQILIIFNDNLDTLLDNLKSNKDNLKAFKLIVEALEIYDKLLQIKPRTLETLKVGDIMLVTQNGRKFYNPVESESHIESLQQLYNGYIEDIKTIIPFEWLELRDEIKKLIINDNN